MKPTDKMKNKAKNETVFETVPKSTSKKQRQKSIPLIHIHDRSFPGLAQRIKKVAG